MSGHQEEEENEEMDMNEMVNLDPSVATLLTEPITNDTSAMRVRIAQMKLQQARVRGNSDYAAKIMDHAIEEGARDRQAWTLLDKHISKLERHVASCSSTASAAESTTTANNNDTEQERDSNEEAEEPKEEDSSEPNDGTAAADSSSSEQIQKLEQELSAEKERASTMETLLEQCVLEEIQAIQAEQASIQQRSERIQSRIRFLQLTIHNKNNNNNNNTQAVMSPDVITKLENALQKVQEHEHTTNTATTTYCTVCHERQATKAVIPCGHLCLCEECTQTMTKLETSVLSSSSEQTSSSSGATRQCPLCRGQLLSTLRIYTTK